RLNWLQDIDDAALADLYARVDGLLFASEGEGFGLPIVEAAQHGLPLLLRDLPVFREVAGEHATYFSASDGTGLASS
ncbi:glycosyltransferase family 4 protein, partial [Bacteroides thetaiotaomicron]|nr:glycosyltransferase family 4 protein [Bacteroides thetaiotaomicron]